MKHTISITIISIMIAVSCIGPGTSQQAIHDELNSVYYWKTVFHLDSADLSLIMRHDIERVYLRMFDVSEDAYSSAINEKAVPNASVKIDDYDYIMLRDSLSDKEFVPVVYITLDALKAMTGHEGILASNIVTRVRNMCQYNGLPNVREIQLDCDWTASTESLFFNLCDSVRQVITELQLQWRLSSTIRLHQLSRKAPPVDSGVLMVYNTGSFNNIDTENSIIAVTDVKPYLKYLPTYPLHLDVAYPTYSWQLLFRKRKFIGLLNGLNLTDTTQFVRRRHNVYVAKQDIPYNDRIIRYGDMIREEASSFKEISAVKVLIEKHMSKYQHSNILYHFDSNNLSKYTSDEIDNIFSVNH